MVEVTVNLSSVTPTVNLSQPAIEIDQAVEIPSRYGGMHCHENTTASVIDAANQWHLLYVASEFEIDDVINGCTFVDGATGAITAFADGGGGLVTATSENHGLSVGDAVSITGTTNYNGVWEVMTVGDVNTFEFTDTWVADDGTGTFTRGASLVVTVAANYALDWHCSFTPGSNNDEIAMVPYYGFSSGVAQQVVGCETHATGAQSTKYASSGASDNIAIAAGGRIYFGIKNKSGAGNPTFRYLGLHVRQL